MHIKEAVKKGKVCVDNYLREGGNTFRESLHNKQMNKNTCSIEGEERLSEDVLKKVFKTKLEAIHS